MTYIPWRGKDGEYEQIDNDTLKRPREIQSLDAEDKSHVFKDVRRIHKSAKAEEHPSTVKEKPGNVPGFRDFIALGKIHKYCTIR